VTSAGFVAKALSWKPASADKSCGQACSLNFSAESYDDNGQLSSRTDFDGNVTRTSYDGNGLLTQQVDGSGSADQRTMNTTWNTALRVPLTRTMLDASGNTVADTAWVYNAIGQPTARCDIAPTIAAAVSYTCAVTGTVPAGVRRWIYTYCTAVNATQCPIVGLLLTVKGPRTDLTQTTTYKYYTTSSAIGCGTPGSACYQAGDLHTIRDALGHTTTFNSYDGAGHVTRVLNPGGYRTDLTYTSRGWLASRGVAGLSPMVLGYDAMGDVTSVKVPSGAITTFTYDGAHRLTDITDAHHRK
jgi:YD repeat-containing protein